MVKFVSIAKRLAVVAALSLVSTAATAQTMAVDNTYGGGEMRWDTRGGGVKFRYRPVVQDGTIYVCGAFATFGGPAQSRLGREVMRQAQLQFQGRRVKSNLSFFNWVSSTGWDDTLVGREVECRSTDMPAANVDLTQFSVYIRPGTYSVRR